jgi:hypothetical protein
LDESRPQKTHPHSSFFKKIPSRKGYCQPVNRAGSSQPKILSVQKDQADLSRVPIP